MAKTGKPHWKSRAEDYASLGRQVKAPDARQVLDHLARVCAEMAKMSNPRGTSPPESWMDRATMIREASARRWRMREAEYRAMADNCCNDDARDTWLTIARRCAELARYLEATAVPVSSSARQPARRTAGE